MTGNVLLKEDTALTVVDDKYIKGISIEMTVPEILDVFTATSSINIVNDKGVDITDTEDALIGTGTKIRLLDSDGEVVNEITVVVRGDLNGDGKISIVDCMKLRARQLGKTDDLAGAYLEAGLDVLPGKTSLTVVHYMRLRAYQLGKMVSLDS